MWNEFYKSFWTRNRMLIAVAWLSMLISNLLTIALTLLIGRFFSLQFGFQNVKANLIEFFPFSMARDLRSFYFVYAGALLCKLVFFYYARFYGEKAGANLINEIKRLAFNWQLGIPLSVYKSGGAGKYMQRFSGDMAHIRKHFIYGILSPTADLTILMVFFIIVFATQVYLGAGMLVLVIISTYLLQTMDSKLNVYTKIQGSKSSKLFAHISNTLNHLETIHVINRRRIQQKTFLKLNDAHTHATIRQVRQEAVYRTAIPIITYALIFFTLLTAGLSPEAMGGSGIITTILLILYITPVLRRLLASGIIREKGEVSWANLEKIKNLSAEEKGRDLKTTRLSLKIKISKDWQELKPGLHVIQHAYPHHYLDNWLLLRPLVKDKIVLNGKAPSYWKASQWSKLVCPIDERYGLIGKNLHELVCPQLRVFPEQTLQKFNAILPAGKQLNEQMETGENGKLLSPMQKKIALIMRACCSASPIIVTRNLMENIPIKKQAMVMELLKELEGDHILLILQQKEVTADVVNEQNDEDNDAPIVSLIN